MARFLERVGLTGAANMQLRKFSKGMLQRAGIAQAILHDPKVFFWTSRCPGLIRWAAAKFATLFRI